MRILSENLSRRARIFLKNSFFSAASSIFNQMLALLTLPILINSVGITDYGIFALATSALGYFSVLNIAIRSSTVKFVSQYHEIDPDNVNVTFTNAFALNLIMGILVGVVLFAIGQFSETLFRTPPADIVCVRSMFFLYAAAAVVLQPMGAFYSFICGYQKYEIAAIADITWGIVRALVVISIRVFDGSIFWYAIEEISMQFISSLLFFFYARRLTAKMPLQFGLLNKQSMKMVLSYGGWSALYAVAIALVYQGNTLLIGALLSIGAVTYFQIALKLYNLVQTASLFMNSAVVPASSAAFYAGDHRFLHNLIKKGTRLIMAILLILTINLMIFSDYIIGYWMGPQFVEATSSASRFLLAAWLFSSISILATNMYWGSAGISKLAILAFVMAIGQLLLSACILRIYGIQGVAVTITVFYAALTFGGMKTILNRFDIQYEGFMRHTVMPLYAAAGVYFAAAYFFALLLPPTNVADMVVKILLSAGIGFVFAIMTTCRNEIKYLIQGA